jgi:hypothetical protein
MSTLAPWYQQVIDTPAQANNQNIFHENLKLKESVEKLQKENDLLRIEVKQLNNLLAQEVQDDNS